VPAESAAETATLNHAHEQAIIQYFHIIRIIPHAIYIDNTIIDILLSQHIYYCHYFEA